MKISSDALQVHTILYNFSAFYMVFPLGIMYAASSYVGASIGRRNISQGFDYAKLDRKSVV